MTETETDSALIAAALRLAAERGWHRVSVAAAATEAGVSLATARARFPSRLHVLLRFGALADQAALADAPSEGPVRDRLFDLLMRRFDAFQVHRPGVQAVLRALPFDPPLALALSCATRRSMRWMLEAAGVSTAGPLGALRVKGLVAVWLWTLRAWDRDASEDLSGTMAALDTALQRAEQAAGMLGRGDAAVSEDADFADPATTPDAGNDITDHDPSAEDAPD